MKITEQMLQIEKLETVKAIKFLLKEFGIKGSVETYLPRNIGDYYFYNEEHGYWCRYNSVGISIVRVILYGPIEPEVKEILKSFSSCLVYVFLDYKVKIPKKEMAKITEILQKCFYKLVEEAKPYRPYIDNFEISVHEAFAKEKIPEMYAVQVKYLLRNVFKNSFTKPKQNPVEAFKPLPIYPMF